MYNGKRNDNPQQLSQNTWTKTAASINAYKSRQITLSIKTSFKLSKIYIYVSVSKLSFPFLLLVLKFMQNFKK